MLIFSFLDLTCLLCQIWEREKKERWKVQTASFFNCPYLCKQGFARLDWGTSSCVLIVGPSQTKFQQRVDQKPGKYKDTDWNRSVLLVEIWLVYLIFLSKVTEEEKKRWQVQLLFYQHDLCKHGFAKLDWGTYSCVQLWAPPKPKPCRPKAPKSHSQIETLFFTCSDLSCFFKICKKRKEGDE